MPVAGVDGMRGADDEDQNGGDLDHHHDVVGLGAFADAAHQHLGQRDQDQQRRQVEPGSGELALDDRRMGELFGQMEAEHIIEQIVEVGGEADRDAMFETAYSRIRSQPMIQAKISPSVA